MDFKKLIGKAKKTVDDRGGVDSLKADAEELKGIVSRKGSVTDKAKDAAKALKEPGAAGSRSEDKPGRQPQEKPDRPPQEKPNRPQQGKPNRPPQK